MIAGQNNGVGLGANWTTSNNTLVSIVWHPKEGEPLVFGFTSPHPYLWVGIVLVGMGAALVLYSKELSESAPPTQKPATP